MPNIVNKNPLIIDTAGATLLWATSVWIDAIRWVSPTGTAIVQDESSHTIWEAAAADTDLNQMETRIRARGGFKVTTLGGGRLYIYLREAA